jgi:hypothetical protein
VHDHLQPRQADCPDLCAPIVSALQVCTNDACFCPTAVAHGPACSSCIASVNVTRANSVGSFVTGCISEFPVLSTDANPTAVASTLCSSQCQPINAASASCSIDACFCPIILQFGPACSSCWATINVPEASVIATIMSGCKTEFYPSKNTGRVAPQTITEISRVSSLANPTTIASPTMQSRSTGSRCYRTVSGEDFVYFISFVSFIAGLISLNFIF